MPKAPASTLPKPDKALLRRIAAKIAGITVKDFSDLPDAEKADKIKKANAVLTSERNYYAKPPKGKEDQK